MAPQVLFIHNEHLATEALLGEAFTECGYDVATFTVVPAERINDPVGDVAFPDPTAYDVIVPLGARWPVYDEALRQSWVGTEMQMLRDAADAGVPTLGVCFGGQLLAQAFGGSVARSTRPEIGRFDVASDDEANGEVASVGVTHDELRSATKELENDAGRRIRGLVRGFLSRVAVQPCP